MTVRQQMARYAIRQAFTALRKTLVDEVPAGDYRDRAQRALQRALELAEIGVGNDPSLRAIERPPCAICQGSGKFGLDCLACEGTGIELPPRKDP